MQKQLEERVAFLEAEVARLKDVLENGSSDQPLTSPWWEKIAGTFADEPMYDEAMKLGREYRDAQRLEDIEEENEVKHLVHPIPAISAISNHDSLRSEDTEPSEV